MAGSARHRADMERVLEAADYRAREILSQAGNYDKLRQPKVANETLREHYRPLRDAIKRVRSDEGL